MTQFIDRAGWGARAPKGSWSGWGGGQPSGVAIHWEGAGGQPDHANCAAEVRSIQSYHMDRAGYIDVAYNAMVCMHGTVYEGRPVGYKSAAQNSSNATHVAICFLGGPNTLFTNAAKAAVNDWINTVAPAQARGNIQGHRETPGNATACPGDAIVGWIHAGRPADGAVPLPPTFAPPPPPASKPVLRKGNKGPAVMELQRKLNGVTGAGLVTDGDFGPRTDQAVRNFQAFFKLGTDGIVGPKTWGMLDYCAALKGIR